MAIYRDEAIALEMGKYGDASRLAGATIFVSFDVTQMQLRPGRWAQPVTVCMVRCIQPWAQGMGIAICHPNDIQNSKIGERVAFKRAMHAFMDAAFPGKSWGEKFWWDVFRRALFGARAEKAAEQARVTAEVMADQQAVGVRVA